MAEQFKTVAIDVSKRENGKFAKVGSTTIHVPMLKDILPFITSPIKAEKKTVDGKEVEVEVVDDDGIPVYASDEANWVQAAIIAAVKAQARNKLNPGTATVKDGLKIPETWAELCAEGQRGQGEGLAILREVKAAFAEWLKLQNISEAAQNTLNTLFGNKAALAVQQKGTKDKVKARVEAFASTLADNLVERFERPLQSVIDACDAAAEADPLAGI